MRLLPSFWNKKKKPGDASVGGVASFNADQDPRVVADFAESPSGPAVPTPGHGHGGQGAAGGAFHGACPSLPPTQQMCETNAFLTALPETPL